MAKVYLISGLGLQTAVFSRLDFGPWKPHSIHWVEPEKGETLETYARRLTFQLSGNHIVLVGLSFGGIVAIELARLVPIEKVILISSISCSAEKPLWMRIYRLFSFGFYQRTIGVWGPLFGVRGKAQQRLFLRMFGHMSDFYVRWAIAQVIHWRRGAPEVPYLHLQGDKDRIFPIRNIRQPIVIPGGDHGMVLGKASALSKILQRELTNLERSMESGKSL